MNEYTLSDYAAVTNGNGLNGGGFLLWIVVLMLLGGGGFWGRNGGDFGQYASAASQQEILFGQQFNRLEAKADSINNGICSSTYALNNAITTEGRGIQTQLADGFCGTNRNIDGMRSDLALTKGEILGAIREDGEKTRGLIQQNEIQALRDRVQSLEADSRMCGVVRYPNQLTYNAGQSPFCNCNCNCG